MGEDVHSGRGRSLPALTLIAHRCSLGFASSNTLPSHGWKNSPLTGQLEMCFIVLSNVQFQKGNLVLAVQNKNVAQ